MMTNLILAAIYLVGCVSLENQTLEDDQTEAVASSKEKIVLFSKQKTDLTNWYSCVTNVPKLTLNSSKLQVSINNTSGDCFGTYFEPKDLSNYPVILVRMKFNPAKGENIDLLAGFTDSSKRKTYYPEKAKIVRGEDNVKNYYFDYRAELKQADRQVDPTQITSILFFINILGVKNIAGDLQIEEVSLVPKPD